jgi:tRNA 2-selenouridine synthase
MADSLDIEEFLRKAEKIPIIDVRSEGEFQHAHIPGAINVPLFNNQERAKVGTTYKQVGKEEAIELGLEIVGPKLAGFVKEVKSKIQRKEVLVHCWRGGMRSGSFAWLLETAGLKPHTLTNGYKAYRSYVRSSLAKPLNIVLLGGKTGSGKTRILEHLKELGEQVIDLEDLCKHRGSSFGAIVQQQQPSTEQFENNLYEIVKKIDPEKRVWVEDESKNLGTVFLPDHIWQQMKVAPVIFVDVDKKIRIESLVKEYSTLPKEFLEQAIQRIKKKLGGLNLKLALEALSKNDFPTVAALCLLYYDKAYLMGLNERDKNKIKVIEVNTLEERKLSQIIIDEANKIVKL